MKVCVTLDKNPHTFNEKAWLQSEEILELSIPGEKIDWHLIELWVETERIAA